MIQIGINARVLAKPDPAGVSRYTSNLLRSLAERATGDTSCEFLLFGIDSLPNDLRGYDCLRNVGVRPPTHNGPRAHRWEQLTLPRVLSRFDIDVFHTPAGQPPILSGASDIALVTTIHDISPVKHPEWFSRGYAALYRILTPLAVRVSARVITVSEFTRDEIIDAYPGAAPKTTAVHNGVIPPIYPGTPVKSLAPNGFLLFVGGANRRKNFRTLISAYRQYRIQVDDPTPLVLTGPERDVFADVNYEPLAGVHALGYVSNDELGWLYHNASAFVFPALYEGFGLPIIEAMHAGTPVITSNGGAMAEVAGDAAHLINPLDSARLATAIEYVLSEGDYRERLAERGRERAASFTWERAAERTIAVYRAAVRQ